MMKKIFGVVVAILLAAFIAPYAGAQSIRLGPQAGYQKAKDADAGKFMGGAALRLKLTSALGIEGSINYRQEKFNDGALTVRSWPVMVTGLLYPLSIVYGAVGAGWYNTKFDFAPAGGTVGIEETKQEFGWHFGGGVELPVGAGTKLSGDIRYVFLNYDFDKVPGVQVDRDFYVVSVGLLFEL
jgi:opacity protein-like surface antigen